MIAQQATLCPAQGCLRAEATVVATGAGVFAGAASVSAEAEPDLVAALEQQSFREFRWQVLRAGQYELVFLLEDQAPPEDWPGEVAIPDAPARGSLKFSLDGEIFMPVRPDSPVPEGAILSVLAIQNTDDPGEGHRRFYPARWRFEILGQAGSDAQAGPLLAALAASEALGCGQPGCGEFGLNGAELPAVDGTPDPTPAPAPNPPAALVGDGSLASELQAELARLGCYSGAIDGLWGPVSRRAMTDFNVRAGAQMPVETPTPRALVAVARQPDALCGGG